MNIRRLILLLCLATAAGVVATARAAPVADARIDELIRQLADPDAEIRQQASLELIRLGSAARPALLAASRRDDPAIASAAAAALMALPWHQTGDPPQVRQTLARYGKCDEPGRIAIVSQLAEMDQRMGVPALLRLVVEDPSEDVCWVIVAQLRARRDPEVDRLCREISPPADKSAALMLAARGWMWHDRGRALKLLEGALAAEALHRSDDAGELDYAFDRLTAAALADGRLDEAAELKRRQCERIGLTRDGYPSPVYELFALHANFGPLAGLDRDISRFEAYLGDPQVMYALARLYARQGRQAEALALERAAAASSISALGRLLIARFLGSHNWTDWARREAYASLATDESEGVNVPYNSLSLLLSLSTAEDHDAAGIAHLETVTRIIDQLEGRRRAAGASLYDENAVAAELAWRNARLAAAAGQRDQARVHLDRFVQADPTDAESVLNAYPLLREFGLQADADRLFVRAYEEASSRVKLDPQNPQLMNQLAWLCGRCERNLDEALALAERAVAIEPDNAAYIDTLAEVQFRRGNAAEASRLEARALQLEPGDVFMLRQLRRFVEAK